MSSWTGTEAGAAEARLAAIANSAMDMARMQVERRAAD